MNIGLRGLLTCSLIGFAVAGLDTAATLTAVTLVMNPSMGSTATWLSEKDMGRGYRYTEVVSSVSSWNHSNPVIKWDPLTPWSKP